MLNQKVFKAFTFTCPRDFSPRTSARVISLVWWYSWFVCVMVLGFVVWQYLWQYLCGLTISLWCDNILYDWEKKYQWVRAPMRPNNPISNISIYIGLSTSYNIIFQFYEQITYFNHQETAITIVSLNMSPSFICFESLQWDYSSNIYFFSCKILALK